MDNRLTFLGYYGEELLSSGFDFKELIANHARKLLWNRGFTLHGTGRKDIEDILERCHFETMAGEASTLKFKQGHCILVFGRTLDGKLRLRIPILWAHPMLLKSEKKKS